jgi:hypothetical protein
VPQKLSKNKFKNKVRIERINRIEKNKRIKRINKNKVRIKLRINKFYYQQTAQQISVIHIHRRLLPHVSAMFYCHFLWLLVYKGYIWGSYITVVAVNGKRHCKYITAIAMCGIDSTYTLKLYRTKNQLQPNI